VKQVGFKPEVKSEGDVNEASGESTEEEVTCAAQEKVSQRYRETGVRLSEKRGTS